MKAGFLGIERGTKFIGAQKPPKKNTCSSEQFYPLCPSVLVCFALLASTLPVVGHRVLCAKHEVLALCRIGTNKQTETNPIERAPHFHILYFLFVCS